MMIREQSVCNKPSKQIVTINYYEIKTNSVSVHIYNIQAPF